MGKRLRLALGLAGLALILTAASALAGVKKGATYTGTLARSKEPIALKVSGNGKSVALSVEFAPLYCEGGGPGERQISKPASISKNGSFKGAITYEFTTTHEKTDKLYVQGKFSGKSVKGTARSEFGLQSDEARKNLAKCDGSTTFTAKAK
jgi:hypothetical protein